MNTSALNDVIVDESVENALQAAKDKILEMKEKLKEVDLIGVSDMQNDFLVKILHQSILFIIVIGRWMLPTATWLNYILLFLFILKFWQI